MSLQFNGRGQRTRWRRHDKLFRMAVSWGARKFVATLNHAAAEGDDFYHAIVLNDGVVLSRLI